MFSLPSAPAAAEPGPAGARPRERWDADDDNDENGDDGDDDDGRKQPPKNSVLHELEGTAASTLIRLEAGDAARLFSRIGDVGADDDRGSEEGSKTQYCISWGYPRGVA